MTPTSQNDRLDNTTTNLPLCYGSIAFYLGPQSDEYHTHKWTLYLRSPDPTFDLSKAISKVVFQLHPSFSVPTRELTSPPFEVTESGWGEFEASMRVIWRDEAEERSAILTHQIKLYPNRSTPTADPSTYMSTTVPVVSEKYDEVVFTNPKIEFHQLLLSADKSPIEYPLSNEMANLEYFRTYGDEDDVQRMIAAKQFLDAELRNVKDRLLKADTELDEIKNNLALVKSGEVKPVEGTVAAAAAAGTKPEVKAKSKKAPETKPKSKKSKASTSSEQGVTKKAKTETSKKTESTKSKSESSKKADVSKAATATAIATAQSS